MSVNNLRFSSCEIKHEVAANPVLSSYLYKFGAIGRFFARFWEGGKKERLVLSSESERVGIACKTLRNVVDLNDALSKMSERDKKDYLAFQLSGDAGSSVILIHRASCEKRFGDPEKLLECLHGVQSKPQEILEFVIEGGGGCSDKAVSILNEFKKWFSGYVLADEPAVLQRLRELTEGQESGDTDMLYQLQPSSPPLRSRSFSIRRSHEDPSKILIRVHSNMQNPSSRQGSFVRAIPEETMVFNLCVGTVSKDDRSEMLLRMALGEHGMPYKTDRRMVSLKEFQRTQGILKELKGEPYIIGSAVDQFCCRTEGMGQLRLFVYETRYDGDLFDAVTCKGAFKDKAPLSEADKNQIALGLLRGLKAIHGKGFVHLDIKLENILLLGKTPYIADFGFACRSNTNRRRCGTPGYVAPELEAATGIMSIQPSMDIYSMGVTLVHLFGKARILSSEDKRLKTLINRMLSTNPEERPTASEALAELEQILQPKP